MKSRLSLRPDHRAVILSSLLALTACGKGCGCNSETPKAKPPAPAAAKPTPAPTAAPAPEDKPAAAEAPTPKIIEVSKLPDVVGEVNGRKISKESLLAVLEKYNPDYAKLTPEQQTNLINTALSDLMQQDLLLGEMEKRGIKADEAELKKKLDLSYGVFGNTPEEIAANTQDSRVKEIIEMGNRTMGYLESLYRDEVLRNLTVSENEIRDYYDKNIQRFKIPTTISVRMIRFMAPTPEDKKARRTDAETALKRIKAGEDFGQIALEVSEDAGSKSLRGFNEKLPVPDKKERQNDAYFDWLYFSSPGQVSDIIEYEDSLIILKNDGVNPGKTIPYEEARPQIELTLLSSKADISMEEYGQQLNDKGQMKSNLE